MTDDRPDGRGPLRLIADDLTGALDTAAEFVAALGPVRVAWGRPRAVAEPRAAFDVATREVSSAQAARLVAEAAGLLDLGGAEIAYLKLDSLLRGHAGAEIVAAATAGAFGHVIVAPAFPYQMRRTRDGRQWSAFDGVWSATGEDIVATLAGLGVTATKAGPGATPFAGVTVYDAETDADLDRIVAAGRSLGPSARILWCGSGGLAGALARDAGTPPQSAAPDLALPILGVFGTNHPVTMGQLDRAGAATLRLPDGSPASLARLTAQLALRGAALVAFDLPRLARAEAARIIAGEVDRLVAGVEPPGTLVCGGGETLRALCDGLGATGLDVVGRVVPGVPRAVMVGGRWDGVPVISKSGAFGDADFLARLVAPASARDGRPEAAVIEGRPA